MAEPENELSIPNGSALLVVYWAQFAIALIFVSSRVYARSLVRGFGWDDVCVLIAMVG